MAEKITVIEDNADVRNNIKEILEAEGYQVSIAENGEIGLEIIKRNQPHLVICDIMMPEMDGYQVLEKIRVNPTIAATPFVFLTAKTSKEDLSRGMELGADDYIMKPFTIEELISRIRIRLDKRKEVLRRSEEKLKKLTDNLGLPITKEISSPLKTINAISEMIMTEHFNMDKSEIVEFVTLVNKAGLDLKNIVSKTVNYYQIEKLVNDKEAFEALKNEQVVDTQAVLKEVLEVVAENYQRASDAVSSIEQGSIAIPKDYFSQAIKELLSNAFAYSTKGSMVKVVSGIDGDKYQVTISDEGMGMTDDQINNILAFGASSEGASEGGVGLGLYNAKKIVEVFGGSLTFNAQKGIGTVVKVTLPVYS
ncbi:MAG: hypothetical protein CL843_05155 [Crocinitomicaceae bacterium]|nr:hypothetical protein [Crocinitomicaceae bacterium]|tara:strand:- start:14059 stop:15153 length:1095 start_codon:yes stop_codon:yes gene_type:complete